MKEWSFSEEKMRTLEMSDDYGDVPQNTGTAEAGGETDMERMEDGTEPAITLRSEHKFGCWVAFAATATAGALFQVLAEGTAIG